MMLPASCKRLDDRVVGVALVAVLLQHALALEARRVLGHHAVGVDGEGDLGLDAAITQRFWFAVQML